MDKSRTSGEWERMVSGQLYSPVDPEIAKRHRVGMRRCDRFNRLPLWRTKTKQRALECLIPSAKGKNFEAFAPFYCEYGVNIYVGRNCFVNYNSVFLDVAPITLGDNVLIGPNVTLDSGVLASTSAWTSSRSCTEKISGKEQRPRRQNEHKKHYSDKFVWWKLSFSRRIMVAQTRRWSVCWQRI